MDRIIKRKERVCTTRYSLFFPHPDSVHETSGFSFDCDERGAVKPADLNPCARNNFYACAGNRAYYERRSIRQFNDSYWEPGLMKCDCGDELDMWQPGADIHCDECGRNYNSAGQLLAAREHWGEETGETAADYDAGFDNPEAAFSGDY